MLDRADSDEIDRAGEIPESVVQELRDIGAFGIKIPREYGGLGLSQMTYIRAMEMVTSKDGSLTALLSASQSIGVPQPLKLFGTDEQKTRFFPRLAKGAITAFALTEVDAGSDPANMSHDRDAHRRTARTSSSTARSSGARTARAPTCSSSWRARPTRCCLTGRHGKQITAFIVEGTAPGVEVVHRCRFMGLKAIENGVIRFTNVQGAAREHPLGRGQGTQARADHAEHRAPDAAGERGWWRRRRCCGSRASGRRRACSGAQPIGKHDAIAQQDRSHGGEHVRDGGGRRAVDGAVRARRLRHPPRGGDREDVEHRDGLAHRRRHAADPRRSRLRDGRFAARARRAADRASSARCATPGST